LIVPQQIASTLIKSSSLIVCIQVSLRNNTSLAVAVTALISSTPLSVCCELAVTGLSRSLGAGRSQILDLKQQTRQHGAVQLSYTGK
jgi:hypothetical protein